YMSEARTVLVHNLAGDLGRLDRAIHWATDTDTRQALFDASARLAALLAMACTDLGHGSDARYAMRLARLRGDAFSPLDTQLWIRGQEAILGLYSGRPLPVVLGLIEHGLALSADQPAVAGTAVLLAAYSQTLCLLGRDEQAT